VKLEHNNPEQRSLVVSTIGCLIIGVVGVTFSLISASQAILLDGLFNLTYCATGLFTLRVARLVQRGDDERFPYGYTYFEPLVNGLKGVLVLGISVLALFDALSALLAGGRSIAAGAAIGYGVFASTACWALAAVTHQGAKRSGSPLVRADAKNWLVNAAISSAVLLAFLGILLVRGTRFETLIPYIDPSLVVVVVLISISVPIRMAGEAVMSLLNRAPAPEIVDRTTRIVTDCLSALPVTDLFVRVLQPGRTRAVLVHVVLPTDFPINGLTDLDRIRTQVLRALQADHASTLVDVVFTADRAWGAPGPIQALGR
jgi:cation diffusion facilitator family transporter